MKNLLDQIKEIYFAKGINEKIYTEILIFLKQIIKSCEFTEVVEETHFIDHLICEFNEIYTFYLDTKNRVLEIVLLLLNLDLRNYFRFFKRENPFKASHKFETSKQHKSYPKVRQRKPKRGIQRKDPRVFLQHLHFLSKIKRIL